MTTPNKKAAPAGTGTASSTAFSTRHSTSSSIADNLLQHLDKVKRTGPGTWSARCPAHDDRGPSLAISDKEDGLVLVHCFAECDVQDVLGAVGLTFSDLYPPRVVDHLVKPDRRPFPATDVLRAIAFEALVVSAAAVSLLAGEPFSEVDRERLILATSRIHAALTAAGVTNG